MPKIVIYYPGISDKEVEGDDYLSLKSNLQVKYSADEVIIFNWEKWRDRQFIHNFLVNTLQVISLAVKLPLTVFEPILDKLSDIPSVRKYVKQNLPRYDVDIVKQYVERLGEKLTTSEFIFVGHSLGTIPALHLSTYFSPNATVHLYAPPIGYKGFHKLYKPLLGRRLGDTIIFLGDADPLTWLISPQDREKTNQHVKVQLVDSGHDFYELLHRKKYMNNKIGLGNLLEKIKNS